MAVADDVHRGVRSPRPGGDQINYVGPADRADLTQLQPFIDAGLVKEMPFIAWHPNNFICIAEFRETNGTRGVELDRHPLCIVLPVRGDPPRPTTVCAL